MKTREEILSAMNAIVDAAEAETRSLNDEEVSNYEALEKDLESAMKTAEIKARQNTYEKPRVAVLKSLPAGVEKRDSQEYAFDRYLRTGMRTDELAVAEFAQGEGTTAGGYLIPTSTEMRMVEFTKAFGGISREAEHLNTGSGNPINYPTNDDTANSAVVAAEGAA